MRRSGARRPGIASTGGNDNDARRADLALVARDGALKLGGSILSDVLGFAFVVIATRGFGRVPAGRFFVAMALTMILSNIAKLGADTAFVRFIPKYRATRRSADVGPSLAIGMVPVAVLGVLFGALAWFFGPELARVFSKRGAAGLAPYIRVLAVFLPAIAVYAVALAASRGFGTIRPLVVVDNVLVPGSRTAAALVAFVLGFGAISLAYVTGGAMLAGLVVVLLWIRRLLRRVERTPTRRDRERERNERGAAGDVANRPAASPRSNDGRLFSEFWSFAGPRGIASIFATLGTNVSVLLLGALAAAGAGAVAVFAAATRFMRFGTLARIAVFYVISPQISGLLAAGDRDRAETVYQVSTWWVMAGSWPVYLVLAVWSPLLMRLFGRGFGSGATALTLLSLSMLVSMAAGPVQTVLLMDGHAMWNLINTTGALALVVVLSFALIPAYGVNGAATAAAIANVANNVAAFVEVRSLMRLRVTGPGFWQAGAASLLAFGVVGLVARLVLGTTVAVLVVSGLASVALYGFLLYRARGALELPLLWDTLARRGRSGVPAGSAEADAGSDPEAL